MADDINWATPPQLPDDQPAPAAAKSDDLDWSKPATDAPTKLDVAVQQGQQTPPDTAARILKLQTQTGLDPDLIGRNLDDIEKQANSKDFDAATFQKTSPIVANWMAEHPTHAAIAQPDAGPLSSVEAFFKNDMADPFMREMDAQKRWQIGEKAMNGTITPDDRDELAKIDQRMAERAPQGPQGPVDSILQNWVGNIPTLGRSLWEGAKGSAEGAVVGAIAGEGVGAVPGAGVGFSAGMASYFARMEQANAYLEMEKQGISRPVAMGAALTSGTITGLMMALTGGESSKVAIPALASLQREGLQILLSNPTTAMAMKGYLADIGKQMGLMGAFSGASTMVHTASEEVAKMVDDGSIHSTSPMGILARVFSPENLAAAGEATKQGMVGGAGLGLATSLGHEVDRYVETSRAIQRGNDIQMAGANLALTKVWQETPEHAENLVSRMTKDTPNEHAYLPMSTWNEYWMKKEIDPREAWKSAAGHADAYDEAQRTGADLQLPMSKYMTTIGASEHGKFFSQEVRTDPLGMNAREAQDFAKTEVKAADQSATNVPEPLPAPETQPITPAQAIIQKARQQQGLEDFFPDPKKVGMTDEQAVAFTKAEASARDQAEQEVADKLMRKAESVRKGILSDKRDEIQGQVAEQVDARPDQFARAFLTKGTQPNGEALPEGMKAFKLSREAIKEDFGDIDTSNLPKGSVVSQEKATNADITARAESTRAREMADYEAQRQSFELKKEVIGKGVSVPDELKDEGKRIPIWMKNAEGRPLDEVRDELVDKGFMGPNDDIFKFLEGTKAPEKLPTKDAYFTRAKQELAQETSTTGGVHPDEAAPFLGFSSGQELLEALNKSEDRKGMIDRLTSGFMAGEGEIVPHGQIADAAMQAVHNDARAEVLQKGLRYMLSDNFSQAMGLVKRLTRRLPPLEEIRDQAEDIIDAKPYRDTQPALYQREISKATREAGIHFTNGDFDSMFEAKQRELLNHELFRAAADAKEEINDRVEDVAKYSTDKWQEKIGKAGGSYLDNLNDILDRFDFKKSISLQALDKRVSLREWVENQKAQGYPVSMPDKVLNDAYRQSYKDMPNGDVKQVLDSIDTIIRQANFKNKLIGAAEEREFAGVQRELITEAQTNFPDMDKSAPKPRMTSNTSLGEKSLAYLARPEFIFTQLDGDKPSGPFSRNIFQPTVDAETNESNMLRDRVFDPKNEKSLQAAFEMYPKSERALWQYKKTFIPEIGTSLLKPNILMAMLNRGNDGNLEALKSGYGWQDTQLDAIGRHMDERDWNFVQRIWDHVESYRPDIAEHQKRMTGVEPEWVEAKPFTVTLPDGSTKEMRGGYFPIVADRALSDRPLDLNTGEEAKDLFGGNWAQAQTKQGHLIARTDASGMKLLLQFSALSNHISNVIHDITHRETVIDLHKMINDPEIKANIIGAVGKDMYDRLNPWLREEIAGARQGDPANPIESLAASARGASVLVNLGMNFASAAVHATNYGMAIDELGPKYAAKGFWNVYKNPAKLAEVWNQIKTADPSMERLFDSYDRDTKAMFNRMNITGTRGGPSFLPEGVRGPLSVMDAYTADARKALFAHYGYIYLGVAMPSWMGAYAKAMDGEVENINAQDHDAAVDYAGHVVRTKIAAASGKDLPEIMRKNDLTKNFTQFLGPLNLTWNNAMEAGRKLKNNFSDAPIKSMGAAAGTATLGWFAPAVIQALIRGKTPGDDENKFAWAAKAIAEMPGNTLPIVRTIQREIMTKGHGGSDDAMIDIGNLGAQAMLAAYQRVSGDKDELSRTDENNAAMTAGYMFGIPGMRQGIKTSNYVHDWATGNEQPDSVPEGIYRSLVGKKARP